MSLADLAETLRRGDPDRFLALMAAPPGARPRLLPLYAFNLEIARAPWVTAEPMIAEMRLQWWRDALAEIGEGRAPRRHEVVELLAEVIRAAAIPVPLLDAAVAARRRDAVREPFPDDNALIAYLDATGGGLMWASALALGAPAGAEAIVREVARSGALAAWFRAVPALAAAGCHPLPVPDPGAVSKLARDGLGWLAAARARRRELPPETFPALLPAWQAAPVLRKAAADPEAVTEGRLSLPEFSRRGRLLWQSLSGRF